MKKEELTGLTDLYHGAYRDGYYLLEDVKRLEEIIDDIDRVEVSSGASGLSLLADLLDKDLLKAMLVRYVERAREYTEKLKDAFGRVEVHIPADVSAIIGIPIDMPDTF